MPNRHRLHRLHHLAKLLIEYKYRIPNEHYLEGCDYESFANFVFDCIDNVVVKQGVKYFPIELHLSETYSCISVAQEYEINGRIKKIYLHFCTNGKACINTNSQADFTCNPIDLRTNPVMLYSIMLERIDTIRVELSAEI